MWTRICQQQRGPAAFASDGPGAAVAAADSVALLIAAVGVLWKMAGRYVTGGCATFCQRVPGKGVQSPASPSIEAGRSQGVPTSAASDVRFNRVSSAKTVPGAPSNDAPTSANSTDCRFRIPDESTDPCITIVGDLLVGELVGVVAPAGFGDVHVGLDPSVLGNQKRIT